MAKPLLHEYAIRSASALRPCDQRFLDRVARSRAAGRIGALAARVIAARAGVLRADNKKARKARAFSFPK
jgi:hypothetical protein